MSTADYGQLYCIGCACLHPAFRAGDAVRPVAAAAATASFCEMASPTHLPQLRYLLDQGVELHPSAVQLVPSCTGGPTTLEVMSGGGQAQPAPTMLAACISKQHDVRVLAHNHSPSRHCLSNSTTLSTRPTSANLRCCDWRTSSRSPPLSANLRQCDCFQDTRRHYQRMQPRQRLHCRPHLP